MKKATHAQTKAHNAQLILRTIFSEGQISRADVARLTGLTRATVSDVVSGLMVDGLVTEVGTGPSLGGKPPILLSVVDDARYLIGIDLANSVFRGAVVNLRGDIKHAASLPIRNQDGDAALTLAYELIDDLASAADAPILGIGVGTPGLVDANQGVVRNAVNLDWRNLQLASLLETRYGLPIYISNDSQVAALAEYTFGKSKGIQNLIVIKVGRGIGAGIVLDGQLHYGDGSGAGEIGHVMVVEGGERCSCGHHGCLETVASTRAMVKRAQAIAEDDPQSPLRQMADSPSDINSDVLVRGFEAGDESVRAIVQQAGHYLGWAAAHLVGALNTHHIVIAGSAARFGEGLIEPIRQQMNECSLASLAAETDVEISDLGPNIVILGAAALLLANELGLP